MRDKIVYRHNRHGLIIFNNTHQCTNSLDEIFPYTLVFDDPINGWSQYGVYKTKQEAEQDKKELWDQFGWKLIIEDTIEVLQGKLDK